MVTSSQISEPQLFDLLQKKDKAAFAFVYDKYAPALYGALLKRLGNESLAKKILQQGFIEIWNTCVTTQCVKQSLFTWMYSILIKTANKEVAETIKQPITNNELVA